VLPRKDRYIPQKIFELFPVLKSRLEQRVIALLRDRSSMAIVLVEHYFVCAKRLAENSIGLDRGRTVLASDRQILETTDVRSHLTV
jgi:ABC-type branched-subunit amino acid transport system ATPase component